MNVFTKKKSNNYTIIIGCGRLGATLANRLSDEGDDVLIIDRKKESFRKLSPSFGGIALAGDATNMNVLYESEIEKATGIILVTDSDNTSIMIAQIVKEIFKKDYVIARLYDPQLKCICDEFGIDTVCPAILSINEINQLLTHKEKERDI